ncbi:MAG: S8 family serine peptidase [Bacteroidota bacterium]
MRLIRPLALLIFVSIISCEKHQEASSPNQNKEILLTPTEINEVINSSIEQTGDFSWKNASDQLLWSAVMHGDSLLTVGYGNTPNDIIRTNFDSELNLKKGIINNVLDVENKILKKKKSTQDISIYEDEILTIVDLKIVNPESISMLRKQKGIRYLEPSGYAYNEFEKGNKKSDSGCSYDTSVLNTDDYNTIAPNSKASWVHYEHNIPQAWNYSTGSNITIGLIDTGVSPNQPLLGSNFNDGYSSGRSIEKYGTFVDSFWWWVTDTDGPNDQCGHGTSMAATIASPRNDNGMPVGVAYNSNLVAYRATSDVLLDDYHEKKGVAEALTQMANRSDVKIISMSIGNAFTIDRIKDAVIYAYNKNKLIFAAGGTSTNYTNWYGVIFPASMSETVAVTGITDSGDYSECDVCHKGDQIDFTIVMQRHNNSSRTSPIIGFYDNTTDYVGGSSVATATTAGIAALVWAKNPSWNRTQILDKLKQSAEFYPNKHSDFGYGNIDALIAVQ